MKCISATQPKPSSFVSEKSFALRFLTRQLASTANCFCLAPRAFFGRLFIGLPEFHFPENTFTLHLLLECPKRLIDIVIADHYLHLRHHLSVLAGFEERAI